MATATFVRYLTPTLCLYISHAPHNSRSISSYSSSHSSYGSTIINSPMECTPTYSMV